MASDARDPNLWPELLRRALLRGDRELLRLYSVSPDFRATIEMLVASWPTLVDALAKSARETMAMVEAMERERLVSPPLSGPWMVPTFDSEEP